MGGEPGGNMTGGLVVFCLNRHEILDTMKAMLGSVERFLSNYALSSKDNDRIQRILKAMQLVDRQYFAPRKIYLDTAIPIGYGQTISQPSTVGRMLMIAELEPGDEVLELGSGSGWNAALIGYLTHPGKIMSTEIVPELTELSQNNLDKLRRHIAPKLEEKLSNVEFVSINVFTALDSWTGQYDKIIITGGLVSYDESKVDRMAKKLLKQNGILICPHSSGPLIIIRKINGETKKQHSEDHFSFVPLYT